MSARAFLVPCAIVASCASCASVAPRPAIPEERATSLTVAHRTGAEACPGEAALQRHVTGALGHWPFSDEAPLRLSVVFSSADPHIFEAMVAAEGEGVEPRETTPLTAPSCEQLERLVVMRLAILIDTLPPIPPPPPPLLRIEAGLAGHLAVGTTPSPAPGIDVHAGVRADRWSFSLEGRWDAPAPPAGATEIRASLRTGTLAPCFHYAFFLGCVLGSLGVNDVDRGDFHQSGFYASLGPRLGAELCFLDRFTGRLTIDLPVPLHHTRYVSHQQGILWILPPVSTSFGLGLSTDLFRQPAGERIPPPRCDRHFP